MDLATFAPGVTYVVAHEHDWRPDSMVSESVRGLRAIDAALFGLEQRFERLIGINSRPDPDDWNSADVPDSDESAETLRFHPARGGTLAPDE